MQYRKTTSLHTASSHETTITIVPLKSTTQAAPKKRFKLNSEATPRLVAGIKDTLKLAHLLPDDLHSLVLTIIETMQVNVERTLPLTKRIS